jgi:glycerol-3-phosphate dehydrogenase
MAEDAINAVQQQLGFAVGGCVTRAYPLNGSKGYSSAYPQSLAAAYQVSGTTARHLSEKFGTRATAVLELAKQEPELSALLVAGYAAIRAEIAYATRNEMAATLDDVLGRRTGLQFFSWNTAIEAAPVAAEIMRHEMNWDDAETERAVSEYVETLSAWMQKIGLAKDDAKA